MKIYRRTAELVDYYIGTAVGWRNPLLPPSWLHSVGGSDFITAGQEFFKYFVELAGLKPNERVLDIGCGTGRMALPLTSYITKGRYDGIDIVERSIKWCQGTYRTRYPHFNFYHANIFNKEYNPDGNVSASVYRFPFENASFDFAFMTSVVTHMVPNDAKRYLEETARVLQPGGRCLITWFVLNDESEKLIAEEKSQIPFMYELDGCRVKSIEVPEQAIAYREATLLSWYQQAGLAIETVKYGAWCGRENGFSFQDIILARKEPKN